MKIKIKNEGKKYETIKSYLQLSISMMQSCRSIGKYCRFMGQEAVMVSLQVALTKEYIFQGHEGRRPGGARAQRYQRADGGRKNKEKKSKLVRSLEIEK